MKLRLRLLAGRQLYCAMRHCWDGTCQALLQPRLGGCYGRKLRILLAHQHLSVVCHDEMVLTGAAPNCTPAFHTMQSASSTTPHAQLQQLTEQMRCCVQGQADGTLAVAMHPLHPALPAGRRPGARAAPAWCRAAPLRRPPQSCPLRRAAPGRGLPVGNVELKAFVRSGSYNKHPRKVTWQHAHTRTHTHTHTHTHTAMTPSSQ